jgi:hypothetical protein
MDVVKAILDAYPELESKDFLPPFNSIGLRDDLDDAGIYIEKWDYSKPIPEGLTLGKPSA